MERLLIFLSCLLFGLLSSKAQEISVEEGTRFIIEINNEILTTPIPLYLESKTYIDTIDYYPGCLLRSPQVNYSNENFIRLSMKIYLWSEKSKALNGRLYELKIPKELLVPDYLIVKIYTIENLHHKNTLRLSASTPYAIEFRSVISTGVLIRYQNED